MSNVERIDNFKAVVRKIEPEFNALAKFYGNVDFIQEFTFAFELLNNNSYLMQIALGDQDGFKRAVLNLAALGLTLNPVLKLAYLIPRKNKICTDIAWRGQLQSAYQSGILKWADAKLVYSKDEYLNQGHGKEPIHKYNPFEKDRGALVGAYCVAKSFQDEFFVAEMPIDEIDQIRSYSESWRAYEKDNSKTTPWVTAEGEMIKKTVIRRASKMWPLHAAKSQEHKERFLKAIEISGDSDPALLGPVTIASDPKQTENLLEMRLLLDILGKKEPEFLEYLVRINKRDLKKLEDLTAIEATQALAMLNQFVAQKKSKEGLACEKAG